MSLDQFIALAASVGACLSAFATFLTVRQIAKQREASYRPELALSRVIFDASVDPILKGNLPTTWVTNKRGAEASSAYAEPFGIPLRNIGLGSAKAVAVSWSFPIERLVSEINALAQHCLIPAYFELNDGILSLKSDLYSETDSMWRNQQSEKIDYVLPAATEREPTVLRLPHAYVLAISALIHFGFGNKAAKPRPEMPTLRADFEYFDIANRTHRGSFDIQLEIIMAQGDGAYFQAYLESRKVT